MPCSEKQLSSTVNGLKTIVILKFQLSYYCDNKLW